MRPEKLEEVQGWITKAEEDLRSAEADLAFIPPIPSDALFHCQQAVKKALKAFLTAQDKPFHKTHDLDELALSCESADPSLHDSLTTCRGLTVYAWRSRYPGAWDDDPPDNPRDAIALARNVLRIILDRLPQSIRVEQTLHPGVVLPPGGIALKQVEQDLIQQALERTGGRVDEAATLLGLTTEALQDRITNSNPSGKH